MTSSVSKKGLGICFGPASGLSIGQLIPLAQRAEAVGFDSIWTGEFGNDCLAWVQAFAGVTKSCRVGSSIVNIFLRHPVVVAAAAAVIGELSGSRLILGLGTSHRSIVEESLGLAMVRPLEYLEEYVQVVKAVLTGKPVNHRGSFFRVEGYTLGTGLSHSDLPVYVAALGPTAAERAAQYADGVLLTLTPPEYEYQLVQRLQNNAKLAGRDPEAIKVMQIVPCFISNDRMATQMAARRMICRYTALPFYGNMFAKAGFQQEVASIREALATGNTRQAWQIVSQPMLEALAAVGDWAACQQTIKRHYQAGADSVILYPNAVSSDEQTAWHEAIHVLLDSYSSEISSS
ncbi:MAG: LLM class flavin-dependent oxidoreductase [Chloroflexi bacterium]|nr:LLM class flavin-dependent oxidoreductase [Chloroflexota bacterium]